MRIDPCERISRNGLSTNASARLTRVIARRIGPGFGDTNAQCLAAKVARSNVRMSEPTQMAGWHLSPQTAGPLACAEGITLNSIRWVSWPSNSCMKSISTNSPVNLHDAHPIDYASGDKTPYRRGAAPLLARKPFKTGRSTAK